ncbi:MAG TPA: hypothetical protein VK616_09515 [Flavitalea sp.]|nr:hypothetical protein [Flavitalea sp.]
MTVRTCLLVSDDPDDHIEFTEALYEISNDTVLIGITHPMKAMNLLALKRLVPDYVILNLTMTGFSPAAFVKTLEDDPALQNIRLIAYGDDDDYRELNTGRISTFLNSDASYSELREFFEKMLNT